MTARTRYFVIISLLVLGVGLGTGLVAYYVGFPAGAFSRRGGPDELEYIPRDATVVAFANVQEVMASELRRKLHEAIPMPETGQHEIESATGINVETDIDRIVACLHPDPTTTKLTGAGMVLARGRFNEVKIEALMRDHGATVEDYKGKRLIVADFETGNGKGLSVAFIEPGLVALGSTGLVRSAIDLHQSGDNPQAGLQSVTGNDELMNLVRSLDDGNAWAVGRFDVLQSQAHLSQDLASRLPPITWFAVSGHVNGGLRGVIRAETRDDEAANNLRDVVRGFLALGKLQAGGRPEFQAVLQSLELGGTGKTVALSFTVPSEVFDAIAAMSGRLPPGLKKPVLH
jgi:hypothetical protein